MKRLLVRLAGGYLGLGALAFALHRAQYLSTSRVREWTDYRSREVEERLAGMRQELEALREELRAVRSQPIEAAGPVADEPRPAREPVPAKRRASRAQKPATQQATAQKPTAQRKQNRRPREETPVDGSLAA